jgi:hypothetical protein
MNVDHIFEQYSGHGKYTVWSEVIKALQAAGVQPVAPTADEEVYGMSAPLPCESKVYGRVCQFVVEGGSAFGKPGYGAIVAFNRTMGGLPIKAYIHY